MAIKLTKGGNISLKKEAPGLTEAVLGLGWSMQEKKGLFGGVKKVEIDLDASCLMFDGQKQLKDAVWFKHLVSTDGSITHTGDDLTGGGAEGTPNEEILVKLDSVPQDIQSLVFTVNSFSSATFDGIPNAFCVLKDNKGRKEIAHYNLSVQGGGHTGLVIAKLYRHGGEWKFKALEDWGSGRTFDKLIPIILPSL
ncbi:TerD family protein [Desulforhopalus vacuolatus]|uniref:TerD family protein n=1 Tax=Desulforhopalus vacuolatus TaxID=40414 RepID=UPI001963CE34|nr:TerD family protein [Desulforhopalus vacuolatus]MBM9518294.1 TerD family protein [Desulforhopalus vacuolatus]